jgi:hypothetical protein
MNARQMFNVAWAFQPEHTSPDATGGLRAELGLKSPSYRPIKDHPEIKLQHNRE